MFELFVNVFIIVGAIICILGACLLGIFAVLIGYDLLYDTYNKFKIELMKKDFRNEKKLYIIEQLEDLKKRYPDLEIDYKIK